MRGALAAVWRWVLAHCRGCASLAWLITNRAGVARSLHTLGEMLRDGGIIVAVPPDRPAIRTLMQMDGDYVTYVDQRLLERYPTPQARAALLDEYRAALGANLPLAGTLSEHGAGAARVLRVAPVALWLALEAIGAFVAMPDSVAGGWVAAIGAVVWPTVRSFLLWQVPALGIPLLLRLGGPCLLRSALQRMLRRLSATAA